MGGNGPHMLGRLPHVFGEGPLIKCHMHHCEQRQFARESKINEL